MPKNNTGFRFATQVILFLFTVIFLNAVWAAPSWGLDVNAETSKGRALSGLNVYAFAALVVITSSIISAMMIWRNLANLDMVAVLKTKE